MSSPPTKSDAPSGLAPDSTIARYFDIHIKSLPRWDKRPELNFPKPRYINGRKYRSWEEIREFERRAAVAHASKPFKT
jgi:hypothetical protein